MNRIRIQRERRKFEQELHAYEGWLPRLDMRAPCLLGAHADRGELVLSVLSGDLVESSLALRDDLAVHATAGRVLRRLHALPVPDQDPTSLDIALTARLEAWCDRARGRVADALVDFAARTFDPGLFENERRVPCHRDYWERNWLWDASLDGDARLGIIDFEHARLDHPLVDLLKLWDRAWLRSPATREAFLSGYGAIEERQEIQLTHLGILHGLATATRGAIQGDAAFAEHGRRVLEQIRAR